MGTSGPALSALGLGCNNFGARIDADQTAAVVNAALDVGITHFDTAEMYGGGLSEEYLGAALGPRRAGVVIATKFLPRRGGDTYRPGDLARRISEAAEGSLRRLGTDYIDLYYQHYPDPDAPVDELVGPRKHWSRPATCGIRRCRTAMPLRSFRRQRPLSPVKFTSSACRFTCQRRGRRVDPGS